MTMSTGPSRPITATSEVKTGNQNQGLDLNASNLSLTTRKQSNPNPMDQTGNNHKNIRRSPSGVGGNNSGGETQALLHNVSGPIPRNCVEPPRRGISITITPVSSFPDSLEGHGCHGQDQQGDGLEWKTLVLKIAAILGLLYLFVCSLGFLSDSFRLIGGRAAGEVLQKERLLKNPIVGVMMGILVTVAVQSSSTSTSIVVSMVASGLFTVKTAIPIIMGANIGTSVTNTVVALTHMSNRDDFERAFSGAVLHDMFNLLTVSTLLFVESLFSYLEVTTTKLMLLLDLQSHKGGEIQVLSLITKPLTSLIIQIRKDVIIGWSINDPTYDDARLLKVWCNSTTHHRNNNETSSDNNETSSNENDQYEDDDNNGGKKCRFLFNLFDLGDGSVGLILLGISLFLLCGCLILLVKVLSSLLKGKLAIAVQKGVNANIPYCPCLTGYLAMGIGALMTIMVQSSSVFTSALTPLIAMGMISLERAYPLTLGSNLGTTTTAMLAALATEGPNLRLSIQLAACHFLFNLSGILLFYPVPYMRFPIRMAAALGHVTAKYRWFAVFYLIFMFILLPLGVFILTLLGPLAFYSVGGFLGIIILAVLGLSLLQGLCPECLPQDLRGWDFLPLWFRSLEPYDKLVGEGWRLMGKYCPSWCCCCGEGVQLQLGGPLRENRSSEICFAASRSPSPLEFDNQGFTRNDQSFIELRAATNNRVP